VDTEGRRYVDAISSWWCAALGHSHPAIVAAIRSRPATLQHSILGNLSHPRAAELAARLAALMPSPTATCCSPATARARWNRPSKSPCNTQHTIGQTRRTRLACLAEAYHGDTLGAMSVGYQEAWHHPFKSLLAEPVMLPRSDTFSARAAGPACGRTGRPHRGAPVPRRGGHEDVCRALAQRGGRVVSRARRAAHRG
jgi:adenosylmethionine-8-amino-7-oxononanoate aminotransferase